MSLTVFCKERGWWGLAQLKTLAGFLCLVTLLPSLKTIFPSQAMFLRPRGAGRKASFSKKYSYCHPTGSRTGGLPGFPALLVFTRVSEIGGGSQTPCRVLAGRDWGGWDKGRDDRFQKPDTVTIKRRQEEKCFQVSHPASAPDSYLNETEGPGPAPPPFRSLSGT